MLKSKKNQSIILPVTIYIIALICLVIVVISGLSFINRDITKMDTSGQITIDIASKRTYYVMLDTNNIPYDFNVVELGNYARIEVDEDESNTNLPYVFNFEAYDKTTNLRYKLEPLPEGETKTINGYDVFGTITLPAGTYSINTTYVQGEDNFGGVGLTNQSLVSNILIFSFSLILAGVCSFYGTKLIRRRPKKQISKYMQKHIKK